MDYMIRADEKTKARFDNAQRIISVKQRSNLTQAETLDELLTYWETREGVETE